MEGIQDALEIISYVDRFSPFEKRDLRIYALTTSLLKELEKGPIPKLFYLTILIDFLGFKPYTKRCHICKRELIEEDFFIDIIHGISLCKNCIKEENRGIIKIGKEIGKFLQHPQREEPLTDREKEDLYFFLTTYLKSLDTRK